MRSLDRGIRSIDVSAKMLADNARRNELESGDYIYIYTGHNSKRVLARKRENVMGKDVV